MMHEVLDVSWLTPHLSLGGCFPRGAAGRLVRECGIGAVVDMRVEDCDDAEELSRVGLHFLHLPTEDRLGNTVEVLERGVAWVQARWEAGARVHVHCQHGIGRSALLALCALVASGMAPLEAMALAKDAREKVSPSPEQLDAFCAWAHRFRARRAPPWRVPERNALGAIAWRHLTGG